MRFAQLLKFPAGSLASLLAMALMAALAASCSSQPLEPWSLDTPPLVLLPSDQAGIVDERGRFREITCAVLAARGTELPHYRDCEEALIRLSGEPPGSGAGINLGQAHRRLVAAFVPGVGWECIEGWLGYDNEFAAHLEQLGYASVIVRVDGLSGTENNARQIRDQILAHASVLDPASLVLIGYSKGAPDVLTALVNYPEIRPFVAAVVSVAGAVGGSPLANLFEQDQLDLMRHVPDADCSKGDGEALDSLRPATRRAWLQQHPLPTEIPYYSLVTLPDREHLSSVLRSTHRKLSQIDPRNDGQVIFFDQIVPGSSLLAYLNADHWAVAVPVAEQHPFIGRHFVDRNNYPRMALVEALMRFVEEDLERRGTLSDNPREPPLP